MSEHEGDDFKKCTRVTFKKESEGDEREKSLRVTIKKESTRGAFKKKEQK